VYEPFKFSLSHICLQPIVKNHMQHLHVNV